MCKTIYVTGANGFVGRNICDYLYNTGYNVIGISKGENSVSANRILFDYSNIEWLAGMIEDNSVLVHTAAVLPQNYQNDIRINSSIDSAIAKTFSKKHEIKAIYLSSISLYGYGYFNLLNVDENSEVVLFDDYSRLKKFGEDLFIDSFKKHYILRMSSPYGRFRKNANIIEQIINKALNDEDIDIYGKGMRAQDYIYVKDIAKLIEKITVDNSNFGLYNLAVGKSVTILEAVDTIINATHSKSKKLFVEKNEGYSTYINSNKIQSNFRMNFTDFKSGICRYLAERYD